MLLLLLGVGGAEDGEGDSELHGFLGSCCCVKCEEVAVYEAQNLDTRGRSRVIANRAS